MTLLRLIDGSTFEATDCIWLRPEDPTTMDLEVTGNFQHERSDSWLPAPSPISIFIPFRSVVWWQESDQRPQSEGTK